MGKSCCGKIWGLDLHVKFILAVLLADIALYIAAVAEKVGRNDDFIVDNIKLAILTCNIFCFGVFLSFRRDKKSGFAGHQLFLLVAILALLIYNFTLVHRQEESQMDQAQMANDLNSTLPAPTNGTAGPMDDNEDPQGILLVVQLIPDITTIVISTLLNVLYLFMYVASRHFKLAFVSIVVVLFDLLSVIVSVSGASDTYIDIANLTSILLNILVAAIFYSGKYQVSENTGMEQFEAIWEFDDARTIETGNHAEGPRKSSVEINTTE